MCIRGQPQYNNDRFNMATESHGYSLQIIQRKQLRLEIELEDIILRHIPSFQNY